MYGLLRALLSDFLQIIRKVVWAGMALVLTGTALAATCTVTSIGDSTDPGTLRSCLTNASAGDTITFGVTGTITLTSGFELTVGFRKRTLNKPCARISAHVLQEKR
jgi:hypothetical protein